MSQETHPRSATGFGSVPAAGRTRSQTLWVGWIRFAAVMMIIIGAFDIIEGIVALVHKQYYVVSPSGLLVFNLTAWGWVHLIIGALAVAAGAALLSGALWARIVAVGLAAINAIAQLAFVSAHPVWTTIIIALDVLVIWAVIVHGSEVESEY
ncbi:DUF7144 family membrane protein [Amycolatopsis panacis]|uniref:DUF7144 domain-containing protein n=1 Tax=Amycolatopsis panacis TaxID=2340917 RepID=A0A419IBR9_9PSEU|nr:hypothetical protein [Amycolatopsis panacis]RJQ92295.1 hypothetical protein D5S19_00530 [Amycolatopsis panacis]